MLSSHCHILSLFVIISRPILITYVTDSTAINIINVNDKQWTQDSLTPQVPTVQLIISSITSTSLIFYTRPNNTVLYPNLNLVLLLKRRIKRFLPKLAMFLCLASSVSIVFYIFSCFEVQGVFDLDDFRLHEFKIPWCQKIVFLPSYYTDSLK